jgi:predicted nucleotidyltransferase
MGVRYPDREARSARLQRELEAVLHRIVDADTERVILFGSTVRGDVGSKSDLDLLVIRRDARRPAERAADLYARARPTLALDLLVYTPEEVESLRPTSSFLRQVLTEGRVVYDRSRALARTSAS